MPAIMKKITILILASLTGLASCKDFLAEDPTTSLTDQAIFSTTEGAAAALGGVYRTYSGYALRGVIFHEWGCNSLITSNGMASKGQLTSMLAGFGRYNQTYVQTGFAHLFSVAQKSSNIMEQVAEAPIPDDAKVFFTAHAKFMRAVAYFDMARIYGRVPVFEQMPKSAEELSVPRGELKDVYSLIVKDLNEAFESMPDSKSDEAHRKYATGMGLPIRWAAKAYLAKVYLQMYWLDAIYFQAGETPYTDAERHHFLHLAFNAAWDVKQKGVYSLVPDYRHLFGEKLFITTPGVNPTTDEGTGAACNDPIFRSSFLAANGYRRHTEESIFELQYLAAENYGSQLSLRSKGPTPAGSNWTPWYRLNNNSGNIRSGLAVFAEHWVSYGNPRKRLVAPNVAQGDGINYYMNTNNVPGSDPRINLTYVYNASAYWQDALTADNYNNLNVFPNDRAWTNGNWLPCIKKWQYGDFNQFGGMNQPVFRYAALLLVLAEAANELAIAHLDEGVTGETESYSDYPTNYDHIAWHDCIKPILQRARDSRNYTYEAALDSEIKQEDAETGKWWDNPKDWNNEDYLKTYYDLENPDNPGSSTPADYQFILGQDRKAMRWHIVQEYQFETLCEGEELFQLRCRGSWGFQAMVARNDYWFNQINAGAVSANPMQVVRSTWSKKTTDEASRPKGGALVNYTTTYPEYNLDLANNYDFRYGVNPSRDLALNNDFCRWLLFMPYPQYEINNNPALSDSDQNYGWAFGEEEEE